MKRPYNELVLEDKEKIIELYYKNISLFDIEDMALASKRSVRRVLKEAEIDTRRKNRYTLNEHYFDVIDTEEKAYWLGFIYADGYVGDEKFNNIVIGLAERDKGHLEKFADAIEYRVAEGIDRIRNSGPGGFEGSHDVYVINFSSSIMATALRSLGLYPNKSMTMENLPDLNILYMRHFIRGYFDGDGSAYPTKSTVTAKGKKYIYDCLEISIVGTPAFLRKIQRHLPMNSGDLKKSKTEEMKYLRGTLYSNHIQDFYEYFYDEATIFLERKQMKFINSPCMQQCLQKTELIAGSSLEPFLLNAM